MLLFFLVLSFGIFSDLAHAGFGSAMKWAFEGAIKTFLIVILEVVGWLVSAAVSLFSWIVKVDNMQAILNNPAIYNAWKDVRDLLNMSFILVLLFAAFSTILQIEKYNYKKILLTLVIMALLVNFSYPITRGIIDISNTLMYTLIKNLMGNENSMGVIADSAGIHDIITAAKTYDSGISALVATIVFSFIFAITLWAIGIMLVIRIVALAILTIFSPIAFVGAIISLPSSGNFAGKFWDNLFKYAFFGPIMMFMIYIATQIMSHMQQQKLDLGVIASGHTVNPGIVASIAFFAVPIVILWIGLGMAQSMSIAGAGTVMGQAQKMAKWGGKTLTGYNAAQRTFKSYQARRAEAQKGGWTNRLGTWVGSRQDQLRSRLPLPIPGNRNARRDADNRYQKDLAAKVKQESERFDVANINTTELREFGRENMNNRFIREAVKAELASRGQHLMDNSQQDLEDTAEAFGETSQVFRQLNAKIRAFDPVAAFSHIDQADPDSAGRRQQITDFVNSSQFDAKKLGANTFTGPGGEEFMRIVLQEQAISNSEFDDLRKKSSAHRRNINSSLEAVAGDFTNYIDTDPATLATDEQRRQQEINRNVQLTHLAQTGRFHTSIAPILDTNLEAQQQIFSRLNKDNLKRIDETNVRRYYQQIADNMNIGTYKNALPEIENRRSQGILNYYILNLPAGHPLRDAVNTDPRLQNIRVTP